MRIVGYLILLWLSFVSAQSDLKAFELNGAGSTFATTVYNEWRTVYPLSALVRKRFIAMSYDATGSSAGKRYIMERKGAYGASDASLEEDEAKVLKLVPVLAGSVVLAHSVPQADNLALTREIIVGIFMGNITSWNDPLILTANPGLNLTAAVPINVIKRGDSSGTTQIFTNALSSFSDSWKNSFGSFSVSNKWPKVANEFYETGNQGMAIRLLKTSYSIAYIEQSIASKYLLPYASIYNKAGRLTIANSASIASAINDFSDVYPAMDKDKFYPIIVDAPGPNSYPIVGFTYFALRFDWPNDPETQYELFRFVYWTLNDPQASALARRQNFSTLTESIKKIAIGVLGEVKQNNQPLIDRVIADDAKEQKARNSTTCGMCYNGKCVQDVCVCDPKWKGFFCDVKDLPTVTVGYQGSTVLLILQGVNVFFFIITIVSIITLTRLRDYKIIKTSSVDLSYSMLGFILLAHLAIFAYIMDPNDIGCVIPIFTFPLALIGFFISLGFKIWRVYYIFGSKLPVERILRAVAMKRVFFLLGLASLLQLILSGTWVLLDRPRVTLLTEIDNNYFYLTCSSTGTIVPGVFTSLTGILLFSIIAIILYLGWNMNHVPLHFQSVNNVSEICYFSLFMLVTLTFNQSLQYSILYKAVVFTVLSLALFHGIHFYTLGYRYYLALTISVNELASKLSGSHSKNSSLSNEEHLEPIYQDGNTLISHCSRLAPKILSRWSKETVSYDPKTKFMVFKSLENPELLTTFQIPSSHTRLEFEYQKEQVFFTIIVKNRRHYVALDLPIQSRRADLWMAILKQLAALSKDTHYPQ